MSSRLQAYRSKIPVHILQMLDISSRITLYLVGQNGPLSFIFKDRLDNKYKTTIGSQIRCSCNTNKQDHCIHSLYVMLKLFKISIDNPILWQSSYIDSQLTDLLSGKYTVNVNRNKSIHYNNFQIYDNEYNSNLLPSDKYKKQQQYIPTKSKVNRMVLNQDSLCSICQQLMEQNMCLSYCKVKCGNNFHLECIKIWVNHKIRQNGKISCPMCRTSLGSNYLYELEQEQKYYNKKNEKKIKIKYKCLSCGLQNIPNNIHKCILCTNFELCTSCYHNEKHIKHPFIRQLQDGRWVGGQQRRVKEIKIQKYIDKRRKQSINEQLLNKITSVIQDPNKLLDFIASTYPYVSKYISDNVDPYKKLDFDAKDIQCMKCGNKRMIFLRRLNCGHFIDHQCLKKLIREGKMYCIEDGIKIVKGYENLIKSQKQIEQKNQIKHEKYNINEQFNPSRMQPSSQSYNFIQEDITLPNILERSNQNRIIRQHQSIRNNNIFNPNINPNYTNNTRQKQSKQHRKRFNSVCQKINHSKQIEQKNHISRQIRIRPIISKSTQISQLTKQKTQHLKQLKRNSNNMEMMIQAMIGRKITK